MPRSLRKAFGVLLFVPALAAHAAVLGYDGARHLLVRTGFGATEAEILEWSTLEREAAVDRLLAGVREQATLAPPAAANEPFFPFHKLRALSAEERMAEQRRNVEGGFALREWWMREMLATPSPFTEKMTLFWHNHFATSQQKVRSTPLMYRQNVLLRRHALGNFGQLLREVSRDPAMLIYLDNAGSRRQAPNENFAREVMELFTLGEGHYTEKDVKEAARAFTGWSLDRDTAEFLYRRFFHDAGEKTVLGRTGRLDGDDVLGILLEHPQTAVFVTRKLWREFISDTPDEAQVALLARGFRQARLEIRPLLRALLLSEAFWSPGHRGVLVKSPVELVVGTLRLFDVRPMTLRPAVVGAALLGQNLLSPPNVKGWPGGEAWINSATLLGRKQLLERLMRGSDAMPGPAPAMAMAEGDAPGIAPGDREARLRQAMERGLATYAVDWNRWSAALPPGEARAVRAQRLVLAIAPVHPVEPGTDGLALLRALTADPAYQLK